MKELNAIFTIAARDVTKFLRDRTRILATFLFPLIFIGVLGGSFQSNLGDSLPFNYMTFIFTGILAQTLFQSASSGIISLIEDKENDFSQEIFVAPVSRYTIVFGKIVGESLVALLQAFGIIAFSLLLGVELSVMQILILLPISLIICFFGGSFGVLVMSQLGNQRAANQIFPFLIFPQFFLSGAFAPIKELPWYLFILSRISPMTYAVDFLRSIFYAGSKEASEVVLYPFWVNAVIIAIFFCAFLTIGTYFFVKNERNK